MEEKRLSEILEKIRAGLTDEEKAKVAGCKDNNELFELLCKMGVALPDELLDYAAGGFVWKKPEPQPGSSDQKDGKTSEKPDPFKQPKRFF